MLGCGPRAYWHAKAYSNIARGELVAACDLNEKRLGKFCADFDVPGYTGLAEMLTREKPDLVHLVTPPYGRYELMEIVSTHGVPACLVEKPVACGVTDWRQLCALEKQSSTKFAVNHQVRFQRYLDQCCRALESGRLGALALLEFSAGMNISGQGTHILDWAMLLNQEHLITRVYGTASGMSMEDEQHPAPDTTLAQITFDNGVLGVWNNGCTARRISQDEEDWKHLRIAGYAESGRVLFEEFGEWEIISCSVPNMKEAGRVDLNSWEELNHDAQAKLVESMYDWLEDDAMVSGTNLARSLHQWNAVLALYASALWRKPIDLPFDPPDNLMQELKEALVATVAQAH